MVKFFNKALVLYVSMDLVSIISSPLVFEMCTFNHIDFSYFKLISPNDVMTWYTLVNISYNWRIFFKG